ncbi:MAG: glycosyltransferase family 61 protein [Bacteroidetes bacterium]|nr:glycosyltransferase family 61 protein [Bacteroidota bacterium]
MKNILQIYPSEIVKRKPPINIQEEHLHYFQHEFQHFIPESNLFYLKKACVTKDGIIIKNLKILPQFVINFPELKTYYFRYLLSTFIKHKSVRLNKKRKYLLLFDNYSGPEGFSHWISDAMTRIFALNGMLKNYTAILPAYCKNGFRAQSLKVFDFGSIYYIEPNTYVKVDNLYAPTFIAPTGNFNISNILGFRSFVLEKLKISNKINTKRTYISRKKTPRRHILNEIEVEDLMISYGFDIVFMEDHDFAEQISIVNSTKVLVSIHGAALTFLHFMNEDSKVLELRYDGDTHNNHFYAIASSLDIDYYYQVCPGNFISPIANNYDINVEMELLKKNINLMLQ